MTKAEDVISNVLFIQSERNKNSTQNVKAVGKKVRNHKSGKVTGLYLNLKKCKLMAIHDHPLIELYNIPIKNEVKYLGVIIKKRYKS